ncbi:hypothetical protein Salat_0274100 [Sesamum alatum]|uniref:Uncharacterized protein n=1 Tax=Sesamum alatum TaxID=300844 RepID=A0AAE1Z015_9LAMI|nr:hypothetical protein Salat_0274100 [Sesamum alatum]
MYTFSFLGGGNAKTTTVEGGKCNLRALILFSRGFKVHHPLSVSPPSHIVLSSSLRINSLGFLLLYHMEHPTRPNQPGERKYSNPLKYAFDGHFLPATPPDDDEEDTPEITDFKDENSETGQSSESRYPEPSRAAGLAASLQVIANTMLRTELAELEMMKKREAYRLDALKRQAELEDEMTRMMLQTQAQIASFVHQNNSSKKRKS